MAKDITKAKCRFSDEQEYENNNDDDDDDTATAITNTELKEEQIKRMRMEWTKIR